MNDSSDAITVAAFLEAIHTRYGYDFRGYNQESLGRRLSVAQSRLGLRSVAALRSYALDQPANFEGVLQYLTIQVTDLFRDPDFYLAFRRHVVPALKTYPQVKLWHAGCASGEEVYSTAAVLAEEDLLERSLLYGTDLSAEAVEQAKRAVYKEADPANLATRYALGGGRAYLDDHFVGAYGGVAPSPALRKNAVFFQHDLVSDHSLGQMQVIVCRNVLVYFSADLRKRVLDVFAESLAPGGFLCLGMSEQFPSPDAFKPVSGAERIFQRTSA